MRMTLHLDGVGAPQPVDLEYVLEASEIAEIQESIDFYPLRNGKPIAQAIIERRGAGFRMCIEHAKIVGRPLAFELGETAGLWELRPIEPNDSTSGLAPAVERIVAGLDEANVAIRNLSVTTDYVKRQRFLLPFESTLEMKLTTKAIIDSEGRSRNETDGQQVNIEPDGKSVRTYRGRWVGVFQDGVARQLSSYEDNPPTASIDVVLSWHGIDPREFTTHYQHKPVTEIIRSRGAQIAERTEWDGRPVTIVETIPRGDGEEQRRYRFWIDTERQIVVRRAIVIRFADDQPWQEYARIEGRDHHEVAPGIWLPMKVKYESVEVTPDLKPEMLSWSFEGVNRDWQVNSELPADSFTLAFPDGVQVNDHRPPQVPADQRESANLDSPQAVLDAIRRCQEQKDYAGFVALLSDEEAARMTGIMLQSAVSFSLMIGFIEKSPYPAANPDLLELQKINAIVDRYTVDDPDVKAQESFHQIAAIGERQTVVQISGAEKPQAPLPDWNAEQYSLHLRTAARVISDQRLFLADMMKAMEEFNPSREKPAVPNWRLEVNGDQAVVTTDAVSKNVGFMTPVTMQLKKVDGQWRITSLTSDEHLMKLIQASGSTERTEKPAPSPIQNDSVKQR